jgi:hypothetical protein
MTDVIVSTGVMNVNGSQIFLGGELPGFTVPAVVQNRHVLEWD